MKLRAFIALRPIKRLVSLYLQRPMINQLPHTVALQRNLHFFRPTFPSVSQTVDLSKNFVNLFFQISFGFTAEN
ncbi:hypothetical protein [Brucella pituitosa]|uniref:Uncharacterized protein n=1 Tax=Brucella pituitosa TaxID=571256 RepID=A0A643ESF8_9HYPH|nr:hypothetical protein [Brucella pituitosa]KAB0564354.1 hypothetical protein F7Q93_24590 [Brucella pituitosa]